MRLQLNKKYITISAYACISAAIILFLYFVGDNLQFISSGFIKFNNIMTPVYYGIIFAYIANPLLKFTENKIFRFKKKERKLLKRALSLLLTYIIIFSVLTAFFMLLLPQVITSYNDLYSKIEIIISDSVENIEKTLSFPSKIKENSPVLYDTYIKLGSFIDYSKFTEYIESAANEIYSVLRNLIPNIFSYVAAFFIGFKNILIGLIFSAYFLASKEKLLAQIRKILRSILPDKLYFSFYEFAHDADKKFGSFIIGKIVDSLIIGLITFIVLAIIGMPFYPLISVIVCITNVIPFIGPFIGAIPCAFIVLTVSPWYCLIFIIFIIILQQIDGNYIGPKILGEAIGISSLWILFAITVMGGYFGLVGMLIGAPTFAVLYSLIKKSVENRLAKKALPVTTDSYYADDASQINTSDKTDAITPAEENQ